MKSIDQYSNISTNLCNDKASNASKLTEKTVNEIKNFKQELTKIFDEAGVDWENFVEKIWSVGPRKCGSNLLINNTSDYKRSSFWSVIDTKSDDVDLNLKTDRRNEYDSSFINGFQMATLAGPLCEEPMQGVCFVINEWTFEESDLSSSTQPYGPISGMLEIILYNDSLFII